MFVILVIFIIKVECFEVKLLFVLIWVKIWLIVLILVFFVGIKLLIYVISVINVI